MEDSPIDPALRIVADAIKDDEIALLALTQVVGRSVDHVAARLALSEELTIAYGQYKALAEDYSNLIDSYRDLLSEVKKALA